MNPMSGSDDMPRTVIKRRFSLDDNEKGTRLNEIELGGILERETLTDSLDSVLTSSEYFSLLNEYKKDLESIKKDLDWRREENIPIFELTIKDEENSTVKDPGPEKTPKRRSGEDRGENDSG